MKNQERHRSVVTPGKDLSLFVSKMAKIGQRTKQTFANISELDLTKGTAYGLHARNYIPFSAMCT